MTERPARLVDAHVHLWDPARTDWYPYLSGATDVGLGDVTGMARRRPPRSRSCPLPTAWMTAPDDRNSSALKKAWVNRWNTAASREPTASAATM